MATNNDDGMLLSEAVNDFLSRNRRIILGAIAVVALLVVVITIYFSFSNKKKKDDLANVERILFDLNKDKDDIEKKQKEELEAKKKSEDESSSDAIKVEEAEANSNSEEKDEEKEEKASFEILEREDQAILALEKLGNSAKGYASYLALYNIADMYFSRKDYSKAKDYYLKAYTALPKHYVAGVLLFNIGVCIEQMNGELTEALEYYEKASKVEDFPIKPRAMLNVGRLQEKLERFDDAIATYNTLFEKYPDNEFALIGKSRLIELSIKKAL